MAPRVVLHSLPGGKRAGELTRLVERLYRQGCRQVVWVADEGRRRILDDYLWTFEKLSFVPHVAWAPALGEVEEPVVLVGEPANPNRAEALVVGDDLPPAGWAAGFTEVHDLVSSGADGAERRTSWEEAGFEVIDADG